MFTRANAFLTTLTVVFGLYAGAASVGLDIPRWAWVSEVRAAESKLSELRLQFEQMRVESLRRAQLDVVTRIAELEARGIEVPTSLRFQLQSLQRDLENGIQRVDALRNR
jgi:hypothetical protein